MGCTAHHARGGIRGVIIQHHHLEARVGLRRETIQQAGNATGLVARGDEDRDGRQRRIRREGREARHPFGRTDLAQQEEAARQGQAAQSPPEHHHLLH